MISVGRRKVSFSMPLTRLSAGRSAGMDLAIRAKVERKCTVGTATINKSAARDGLDNIGRQTHARRDRHSGEKPDVLTLGVQNLGLFGAGAPEGDTMVRIAG